MTAPVAADENKVQFRRIIDEILNRGDLAVADEIFHREAIFHSPQQVEPFIGPDGFREFATSIRDGFPDVRVTIDTLIAEGDHVAARMTVAGTHTGDYRGIPPTGRRITPSEAIVARMAGGKVQEAWQFFDGLGVMRQLRLFPQGDPPRPLMRLVVSLQRLAARPRVRKPSA